MRDSIFFAIQYILKIILVFSLSISISLTSVLWSLPKGGRAVHKQAKFSQSAKELIIEPDDNSILHFDSFNIQKDETVRFLQQSTHSRVLNKVTGNESTHIYGQLFSNGKVYLVNPAGIFFGQEAIVKVGALYAAAGNITNHDFISNRDYFSNLSNDLINEGFIQAQLVHLLGKNVVNKGSIVAPKGVVSLISADSVLIGQLDGNLFFEFKKNPDNSAIGEIIQDGLIQADQGEVFLGAADIYAISLKQHSQTKASKLTVLSDKGDIQVKGSVEADELKVYTRGSLSHSGQTKVFKKADFIVNQIDVSGLLDASTAVVRLEGADYSRMILGNVEDKALSVSTSSLENIHVAQLELGGSQTESLVIYPMSTDAISKVGKLKLAALGEEGRVHFKKGEHKLPQLEAVAEQELLVEGKLEASSIILSQLNKDSQNALVKVEADITSPGEIKLYSPRLIELESGVSLKAGKDIYIENLLLSQNGNLQANLIKSKENITLSGKQDLSGEISFQADYDSNQTGDFILALESQIHHQRGSLNISGADIQLNGKVWVDESLSLNSSSNQDINLTLKETEGFSLSQSELNRIYVKELSLGSKGAQKIQVQDINAKIADKLSLKAAHVKVSGSQVLSRDIDILASSSVD
ncbi:MAG: filamentous hemagglutinin N-terminal domain-containing protein, partial [Chlamydiales bacterium]|nr:filamentous hemagglutinin N-terminal domain-containing protein [Chlamydiales bacterium]